MMILVCLAGVPKLCWRVGLQFAEVLLGPACRLIRHSAKPSTYHGAHPSTPSGCVILAD